MIEIRITTDPPIGQVVRALRTAPKMFSDHRPIWKQLSRTVQPGIRENIQSRGSKIGSPWPPLKQSYKERRLGDGMGSKQLMRTGNLFQKSTRKNSIRISKKKMIFKLRNVKYAKSVHKRFPFFAINNRMIKIAMRVAVDHLKKTVEEIAKRINRGA